MNILNVKVQPESDISSIIRHLPIKHSPVPHNEPIVLASAEPYHDPKNFIMQPESDISSIIRHLPIKHAPVPHTESFVLAPTEPNHNPSPVDATYLIKLSKKLKEYVNNHKELKEQFDASKENHEKLT